MSEGDHGEKLFLAKIWAFASRGDNESAQKYCAQIFLDNFPNVPFRIWLAPDFFAQIRSVNRCGLPRKKKSLSPSPTAPPPRPTFHSETAVVVRGSNFMHEGKTGFAGRKEACREITATCVRTVQGRYYLKAILLDWNIGIFVFILWLVLRRPISLPAIEEANTWQDPPQCKNIIHILSSWTDYWMCQTHLKYSTFHAISCLS